MGVATSELTILEALVGPIKSGNVALSQMFEQSFSDFDLRLLPIAYAILREAAALRATGKLKTPDAIHAATALAAGCALFVTNDVGFRGQAGLPLVILDDLLAP